MAPRLIPSNASLDAQWEAMTYLEAALLGDPRTQALTAELGTLMEKIETVRAEQRRSWRAEIQAQAAVDRVNYELDLATTQLAENLARAIRSQFQSLRDSELRETSVYRLYFKERPSTVTRLGLESQLRVVKHFPELLAREAHVELLSMAPLFHSLVLAGETVLALREKARLATAEHRAKRIEPLVEEENLLQSKLYRALLELSEKERLSRSWVDRFFSRALEVRRPPLTLVPRAEPAHS